jgi:hypothetical protein
MKFFLDENFPRPALAQLQSAGHTAVHALVIFPPGTPDDQLFAHAQRESAIFITTDKDFFHTIRWRSPSITGRLSSPCAGQTATNCCAGWQTHWLRSAKESWITPSGLSPTRVFTAGKNREPRVEKLERCLSFNPQTTLRDIIRLTAELKLFHPQ